MSKGGADLEEQIFALLQECDRRNQLVVLIFDQFEEFFFSYENELERQQFFELLGRLTNETTRINIVFSLRRDYMHFLLGRDQLKRSNKVIDLLSRDNGYELRNFSRDEAVAVFQRLTERTSFQPEQDLIEAVVDDLIDPSTGRVRPIELQIVGRQLEETAGGITTLAAYQQQAIQQGVKAEQSPKAVLVRSYLDAVVKDCGTKENQRLAYQLMFLLTDKQGRRPIKSSEELEAGIRQLGQGTENVGMILQILVLSDLVSEMQDRDGETTKYQLVHDYLVEYVRAIEEQDFVVLFQAEMAKREAAEKSLEVIQAKVVEATNTKHDLQQEIADGEKRLKRAIKGFEIAVGLSSIFIFGTILFSTWQINNAEKQQALSSLGTKLEREASLAVKLFTFRPLEGFLMAVKTADKLLNTIDQESLRNINKYPAVRPISGMNELLNTTQAEFVVQNQLRGHESSVESVTFSPDGEIIASTSSDMTVRLWSRSGKVLQVLKGHEKGVNSVSFSPDGKTIASASYDGTVRLWNRSGKELQVLYGHENWVRSASFSPDGEILASASDDGTVRLWTRSGEKLQVLRGHEDRVLSVSFSPDGEILTSASFDRTVRLWNRSGEELQVLRGHDSGVSSVSFSPNGKTIASASSDGTVRLWPVESLEDLLVRGCAWLEDYLRLYPDENKTDDGDILCEYG